MKDLPSSCSRSSPKSLPPLSGPGSGLVEKGARGLEIASIPETSSPPPKTPSPPQSVPPNGEFWPGGGVGDGPPLLSAESPRGLVRGRSSPSPGPLPLKDASPAAKERMLIFTIPKPSLGGLGPSKRLDFVFLNKIIIKEVTTAQRTARSPRREEASSSTRGRREGSA